MKNIAMFVAAPFLGLAGIILFPIIGLAMLAGPGRRPGARRAQARGRKVATSRRRPPTQRRARFVKHVALFFAAPFVALAYIALFPVIGLAMLAWTGGRAWRQRKAVA